MMVLAGVQDGFPADHGHAWDTIGDVIAWVASAPARAFEVHECIRVALSSKVPSSGSAA